MNDPIVALFISATFAYVSSMFVLFLHNVAIEHIIALFISVTYAYVTTMFILSLHYVVFGF